MTRDFRSIVAWFCSLCGALSEVQAQEFAFKEKDRIVFLGDSITEQYQYSTDIELYLTTRFPQWRLTFINAGIGGDTAQGGASRFATHVLAESPTIVTINFGMNDAGYGAFDQGRHDLYVKSTDAMLKAAKDAGVRVALLSPNAVDRRNKNHPNFGMYLETQKQFYAPLPGIAEKYAFPFVDQYAVTRAGLERMESTMATEVIPFGDGFHTAPSGGLFMAHAILTGLHAPALVSQAELKVGSPQAQGLQCTIQNVVWEGAKVKFDRLDNALPLPILPEFQTLLPYVNELRDLNHYGLTIQGLPPGKYSISIDGKEILQAPAEALASGVNLGNAAQGPVFDQSKKVFDAINGKNGIVHQRFRDVVMFNSPDWLADLANPRRVLELQKRSEQIAAEQAKIYQMVQPQTRQFEVKPAG